jgi:hypothetical protein
MDALIREEVASSFAFRFVAVADYATAFRIESAIKSGGLSAGEPRLNPARRTRRRGVSGPRHAELEVVAYDRIVAACPAVIDQFLQDELVRRRLGEVTAVTAAEWLDENGLLPDSTLHPGLPLRELLRAREVRSGEQRPPQKRGRWFIVRRNL